MMEGLLKVPVIVILLLFMLTTYSDATKNNNFIRKDYDDYQGQNDQMAFFGQLYQIKDYTEYVDRVFAQSKEVEETTLRGAQSCLAQNNIISLEWYYSVCKRYMRIIIEFCQNMMHTGICKTLEYKVLRKIKECTSEELNTELCQFVTMVKKQKNLEFERVSRLAILLRQSLEQQVCPRSQPFQKYMPQSQRKQCPLQMNLFSQEGYTTPQKKKWKNPHAFQSQPNNWNWEQNIQSQQSPRQKAPQNTWVRTLVVKNNQAQQRQSQQMHVDFNSQEQMNQRYSLRNNDWSQSKKRFELVFQPQLQEITQHVQMLDMQNLVEVHAVPVGQGDCNIITCNKGENVIIFDCGSIGDNIFKKNFEFLQSYFTKAKFVAILISHGDRDHFNMIQDILTPGVTNGKRFISILGGVRKDYKNSFYNFLNHLTNKQIKFHEGLAVGNLCQDETIYFDFIEARAAHPKAEKNKNKNEKGMLMKLSCKGCESSLLFSGDMEGKVADYLAMETHVGKMFLSSTHYKMAHHGASNKANRVPWLRAVSPVEVHVSHMFNHGSFHHPRWEAYYRILYNCPIGTDGPQSHKFTSFRGSGKNPEEVASNIWYRVYSTTPVKGKVCLISLVFSSGSEARTGYYCNNPGTFVSARILQQ